MIQPPVIACEGVSVGYGREIVLRDVNLDIPPGVFLPFVGPNGAGKTTLLRAILGLLPLRGGRIRTPFDHAPAGYVPQSNSIDTLYPVSLRQVVAMGVYPDLGWWKRLRGEFARRVDAALEEFGLAQHSRKVFSELSGGMKQKAFLARAFASGAEVFIMDEPTSELDEASEHTVMDHLHRLSDAEGKTVLLAHHGLDDLNGRTEQVALVKHGKVRIVHADTLGKGLENA